VAKRIWLPISSSDPAGVSDRPFGASEFAVLVASLAFGAPALIVGADLLGLESGLGMTVPQLILAAPLGIVFAAGLLAAAAWAAADNGVPTGLLMRPALGVAGSWVASALQVLFFLAWTALELDFGASALLGAMEALEVEAFPRGLTIIGLGLIAGIFLVAGLAWVTQVWLYRFAFWGALALTVALAWMFLSSVDLDLLLDATPQASRFWLGVDGVMALGVIWFPVVADTARFVSAAPTAASGAGTGFSVAALALVLLGGIRAASVDLAGGDPAALLFDGATSVVAVVVVAWLVVGSIDQPFLFTFSAATALSTINDRLAGRIQAIVVLAIGVVVAIAVPRSTLRGVTELVVLFIAQVMAILIADYFLVRRRYYETDELYRRKGRYAGVNLYGLVAILVGFTIALVIRPVGPENWVASLESLIPGDLPLSETAGVPPIMVSMLISFAIYAGLGRWKIHDRVVVSPLRV